MPQKYAIQWGSVWHESRLKSRDFYRKYGIRTPKIWHTNPPPFMPYEPFLLGLGVVFNLLNKELFVIVLAAVVNPALCKAVFCNPIQDFNLTNSTQTLKG